jgi:hypothetical protein
MQPKVSLLIVLFIITACNNKHSKDANSEANVANRNLVKSYVAATFSLNRYPDIFEGAFNNGTTVKQSNLSITFNKLNIGNLKIQSGKLIACDPIIMHDEQFFTQKFPIGDFPVHLSIAKKYLDERVAFSRIVFYEHAVEKWEYALVKGQKPISINDSMFYCFGVDAGMGIFIDSIASGVFNKKHHSEWEQVFVTKASDDHFKGIIHEFDGVNLAVFSTGFGDGCYATYIGFDKQGNVCQMLTDFGVVDWRTLVESSNSH